MGAGCGGAQAGGGFEVDEGGQGKRGSVRWGARGGEEGASS